MKEYGTVKASAPYGNGDPQVASLASIGYRKIGNNQCQHGDMVNQLASPKNTSRVGIGSSCSLKMRTDDVSYTKNTNDNIKNVIYEKEKITSPMMQPKPNISRLFLKDKSKSPTMEEAVVGITPVKTWSPSRSAPAKGFDKCIGYLNLVDDAPCEKQPLCENTYSKKNSRNSCGNNTPERRNSIGNDDSNSDANSHYVNYGHARTRPNKMHLSMSSISPHDIETENCTGVSVTSPYSLKEDSPVAKTSIVQRPLESSMKKSLRFTSCVNDGLGDYDRQRKIATSGYAFASASPLPITPTSKGVTRQMKTVNGKIVFMDSDDKSLPVQAPASKTNGTNNITSTTNTIAIITPSISKAIPSDNSANSVIAHGSNKFTVMRETKQSPSKIDNSPSKDGSSPYGRRSKSWKPTTMLSPLATTSRATHDTKKVLFKANKVLCDDKVISSDGNVAVNHLRGSDGFNNADVAIDTGNKLTSNNKNLASSTTFLDVTHQTSEKVTESKQSPTKIYNSPSKDGSSPYGRRAKSWKPTTMLSPLATTSGATHDIKKGLLKANKVFCDDKAISSDGNEAVNGFNNADVAIDTGNKLTSNNKNLASSTTCLPVTHQTSEKVSESKQSPSKTGNSPSKDGSSPYGRRAKSWKPSTMLSPLATTSGATHDGKKCELKANKELCDSKAISSDGNEAIFPSKGSVGLKNGDVGIGIRSYIFKNNNEIDASSTNVFDETLRTSPTKVGSVERSIHEESNPLNNSIGASTYGRRAKSWKPTTMNSPSAASAPKMIRKIKTVNGKIIRDPEEVSPRFQTEQDTTSVQDSGTQSSCANSDFKHYVLLNDNHQKSSDPEQSNQIQLRDSSCVKVELLMKNEPVGTFPREKVSLSSYISKKNGLSAERSDTPLSEASSVSSRVIEPSVENKLIRTPKRTKDSLLLFQRDSVHVHNQRSPSRRNILIPSHRLSSSDISDCLDDDSLSEAASFDSDDNNMVKKDFVAFQKKCLLFDPSIPSPCRKKKAQQRQDVLVSDKCMLQDINQEVEEDLFSCPTLNKKEKAEDPTTSLSTKQNKEIQISITSSGKRGTCLKIIEQKKDGSQKTDHKLSCDTLLDRATIHEVRVSCKPEKDLARRSVARCPTGLQDIIQNDVTYRQESAATDTSKYASTTDITLDTRESLLKRKKDLKSKGELRLSFCEDKNQTWEVMHWSDLQANEMCNLWLTKSDFTAMKAEYESILYLIASNKPIDEENHSSRGLEKRTEEGAWELYECLRDSRNAVLDTQDDQKRKKQFCHLQIAKVYTDTTTKARDEAIKKARQDAKEVKAFLKSLMGKLSNKPNGTGLQSKYRNSVADPNPKVSTVTKRICFSENETICEIPHLKSIPKEEHRSVWFTPKEKEAMDLECKEALDLMEVQEEKRISSELVSRGLENRTVDGKLKLHSRQRLAWDVVLKTQTRQRKNNIFDPLEIANLYNEATSKSLKKAMKRAKSDFKASK
jgi:hypothetical protein